MTPRIRIRISIFFIQRMYREYIDNMITYAKWWRMSNYRIMTKGIEIIHICIYYMQSIPVNYLGPPSAARQETPPTNTGESREQRLMLHIDEVPILTNSVNIITMTSWWTRWRFISPGSPFFTQAFFQTQIKENIKGPVTRKMFPFDDVIIIQLFFLLFLLVFLVAKTAFRAISCLDSLAPKLR